MSSSTSDSNSNFNSKKFTSSNSESIEKHDKNKGSCCTNLMKFCSKVIVNNFSFHAPSPAEYEIKERKEEENLDMHRTMTNYSMINGYLEKNNRIFSCKEKKYKEIEFFIYSNSCRKTKINIKDLEKIYPFMKINAYKVQKNQRNDKEKDKESIIVLEILNKKSELLSSTNQANSILFCHGNATDLGKSVYQLIDFCYQFQCSIYSFDYSGYGHSKGKTTESAVYRDMSTVIEFLTLNKPGQIRISNLIL